MNINVWHLHEHKSKQTAHVYQKGKNLYILLIFLIAEMINARLMHSLLYTLKSETEESRDQDLQDSAHGLCSLTSSIAEIILTFSCYPGDGSNWECALCFVRVVFFSIPVLEKPAGEVNTN